MASLKNPPQTASSKAEFVRWFQDVNLSDIPLVGGKSASLGEMYQELTEKGIRIPNGFSITTLGFQAFLDHNSLSHNIADCLQQVRDGDTNSLQQQGSKIRSLIQNGDFPESLKSEIIQAYESLTRENPNAISVAVRSSATAEDLPDASFAGQQETYLNVQGNDDLLDACKKCFASLYTDRAISYRKRHQYEDKSVALSICVQKMVRSDSASAGVMFTLDTETGFQQAILINSAYGLGENVVQGSINPDEFIVYKPTLKEGYSPILQKKLGKKSLRMVYNQGTSSVKNEAVPESDQHRFSLSDEEILQLAQWAIMIEDHYSQKRGTATPMDIEWAKDGQTGDFYIVQARPETVHSQRDYTTVEKFSLKTTDTPLLKGIAIGSKISHGQVRVIENVKDLSLFQEGDVLVAQMTDPDWEPAMRKAAAIVSDRGGRTCHAAIVSRELGLPAVIGTGDATSTLTSGQEITVSCAQGAEGYVYKGKVPFERELQKLTSIPETQTKLMMNLANPDEAFRLSFYPNSGVGLTRLEFIINNHIKVHPLALLNFEEVTDPKDRAQIESLTRGYEDKSQFFVDKLAEGISMIAAAFHPKDVIVRMSDFKTDEYANLIGGSYFEPKEDNPMIGFRGASRYYSETYRPAFALECKALKKVRDQMGLTNLKAMIPFCRTVEEAEKVITILAENGLKQKENQFEVYVMCEIPSNVFLADQFAKIFDGFSIGSNDLTQLILGVDRNSGTLAHLFDEQNPAVKQAIAHVIQVAKENKVKVGICGQGPSDSPEFAQFLVKQGIDSISLTPDSLIKTIFNVAKVEKKGRG